MTATDEDKIGKRMQKQWSDMMEIDKLKTRVFQLEAALAAVPQADKNQHKCFICGEPFKLDDVCASDINEGPCHAACLEGSPVVDLETSEPIPGGKVDTYPYRDIADPPQDVATDAPQMVVSVKPLAWSKADKPENTWLCIAVTGEYVVRYDAKRQYYRLSIPWISGWIREASLEDAFATAQTKHDARIRSALSAQVQDVATPEGWQLVPKEPTEEMHNAARDWAVKKYGIGVGTDGSDGCYKAMLAAAPAAKQDVALFGPFAHLNGAHGLSEDDWTVDSDPDKNDDERFTIPLYSLVDPFAAAPTAKQDAPGLESNPVTLRWWCQQLLDVIENYNISHDSCDEEMAMLNDIRASVDPAHDKQDAPESAEEVEPVRTLRDNDAVWARFYRDGKNLGQMCTEFNCGIYDLSPWLTAPLMQQPPADAALLEEAMRKLTLIAQEARVANDVIRLNRDDGGNGRVKVATAMHRVEEIARATLEKIKARIGR